MAAELPRGGEPKTETHNFDRRSGVAATRVISVAILTEWCYSRCCYHTAAASDGIREWVAGQADTLLIAAAKIGECC